MLDPGATPRLPASHPRWGGWHFPAPQRLPPTVPTLHMLKEMLFIKTGAIVSMCVCGVGGEEEDDNGIFNC